MCREVTSNFQIQSLYIHSVLWEFCDLDGEHAGSVERLFLDLLTSFCYFEQLHLSSGVVICVSDVQLLGKNIPCKSLILLYFYRLDESGSFIIEIRIPAVCMC